MLKKEENQKTVQNFCSFKVASDFTYLGIKIVPTLNDIVSVNYNSVVEAISKDLERWSSLPISLIGRINIVKMNLLPKFIYLFQNIPLTPPVGIFTKISSLIRKFIWKRKPPRIRLSLLYLPFDGGGLKCPNLHWYYLATQLRTIMFYFSSKNNTSWVNIESNSVKLPLHLYLYSADSKSLKVGTTNPIVRNMIDVWFEVRELMNINDTLSQFCPIWGNSFFRPGRMDAEFQIWAKKGLEKIGDLYNEGILTSFEEIIAKFDIPKKHFF